MTAPGRKKKAAAKHMVAAKVSPELKQRIDRFAQTYDLEPSEAIRTLLSFALTEEENPKTRIMYALYNNISIRCYKMLQEGLTAGMTNINQWLVDNIGRMMSEQDIPGA